MAGRSRLDTQPRDWLLSFLDCLAPRAAGGPGPVNRRGLDFYDRLVDGFLARGISPVATLYPWDLPQALQDRGGWEHRDSGEWFADYATVLFTTLGDRVDRWLTINEAKIIAEQGYEYGRMAPGKRDLQASGTVIHHLNLAHGRAVAAFRGIRSTGRSGPACNLPRLPRRPQPAGRGCGASCRHHGEHSLSRPATQGPLSDPQLCQ